jgi:hypothetical protein
MKSPFPEGEYIESNKCDTMSDFLRFSSKESSELTDDSFDLSIEQKNQIHSLLRIEMLTINLLLDYVHKMEIVPKEILTTDLYHSCYKEICISKISGNQILSEEKISPFFTLIPRTLFLSATVYGESQSATKVEMIKTSLPTKYRWCFDLLELISILSTTKINPYTHSIFEESLLKQLNERYDLEIKMYRRFLKWQKM